MTQDQHNEEWLKEAADLAERLHYAAYTWGFDVAKCGATTDTTIAMNRAKEKLAALLAHLQQRPLPVREWSHRWNIERDGDDLLVCFDLHDKGQPCEYERFVRSPSLPVREEPTHLSPVPAEVPAGQVVAWMWQHEETGNVGFIDQWQIDNGWQAANPRLRLIRPLVFAASPSVQNMGEGETGKDGVKACRYTNEPGGACWREGKAVEICTCHSMTDNDFAESVKRHAECRAPLGNAGVVVDRHQTFCTEKSKP